MNVTKVHVWPSDDMLGKPFWVIDIYAEGHDSEVMKVISDTAPIVFSEVKLPGFRPYLRCGAPSIACFNCQHLEPCRALNKNVSQSISKTEGNKNDKI